MLYSGTDPESYTTEYTSVYEGNALSGAAGACFFISYGVRFQPQSCESGTYKAVKARLWPWLPGKVLKIKLSPLRKEADALMPPKMRS